MDSLAKELAELERVYVSESDRMGIGNVYWYIDNSGDTCSCGDCDSYVGHRNESPCIDGYVICRMKTGEAIEKLSRVNKSSKCYD